MKRVVLFDLDGTILDSKPGIFQSAAYALDKLGLPMPTEDEMIAFLGPPLSQGFADVCRVPAEMVEDAVRLYRENYTGNEGMFCAEIYSGVRELLTALRENGKQIFITTSKPQVYARRILERFDIACLFDGIYGCELDGTRGHKSEVIMYCLEQQGIEASDVVLVGDRHFDVLGAKTLGIPCIGVLYGYGTQEELQASGAIALAESSSDVLKIVLSVL